MKIRPEYPHCAAWDAHGMAAHLEDPMVTLYTS